MNSIQNLSKRIRKRIQNSVKRLFTARSSTYEDVDLHSNATVKINGKVGKMQSSCCSAKSFYSANQHLTNGDQINKADLTTSFMYHERKNIPTQSGEAVSISDHGKLCVIKYSSSQSSGIKSSNQTKTTSRTRSEKSRCSYNCPTGRHLNQNTDDPCVCVNIEQLLYHQTTKIVYEWHKFKSEPTTLDSFKLEYPNTCIQGGQGVVFWVYDFKNNRHFALKMKLRNSKSSSSWSIEQRESKMLRKIQHNFIVNLYHVHETPGALFMTMEYLDGGCLWSHIAKKGTLPESYTTYYAACILNALHHLHQKDIVYRDLKAENIVLDAYGRPKLIDFGMAKKISNSKNNDEETEHYPATQYYYAAYLAPEIYSKPSSASIFVDSWGLGYVVAEILLGYGVFLSMPWEKIDASQKENWQFKFNGNIQISSGCKTFLEGMLKNNPNSRMSLEEALNHQFFRQVHWSTLVYVKPPDLSIFRRREKGSITIQAVPNDRYKLSAMFEFYDLQLPDPLLTPNSTNQCNTDFTDVASPKDTPINPNAPSIRLPILVTKGNHNYGKYNQLSNNLKYDIYRALSVHNSKHNKVAIDTISNLRPLRRF